MEPQDKIEHRYYGESVAFPKRRESDEGLEEKVAQRMQSEKALLENKERLLSGS